MTLGSSFVAHAQKLGLFWVAATAIWLLLVNRWMISWVDGPVKTVSIALALPALIAGASFASRGAWTTGAPALVLGVLLVGEAHRLTLRASYRAPGSSAYAEPLSKPITTTSLEVRHFRIVVPALQGEHLRVAHLTDLHIGDALPFDFYAKAIELARTERPDVLVLTGDFIERREGLPLLARWAALARTAAPRVVYSLGNHDYWTDADAIHGVLEGAGIERASGRMVTLRESPTVVIGGTDVPWGADAPAFDEAADVRIALSHTPDNIYDLEARGATVVFSGHNHGGQVRLPLVGAIVIPSRYGRRFDRGHFRVGATDLVVSAGVGADRPALRLFCPPEVVVVDLVGA